MNVSYYEAELRKLSTHVWEGEVSWAEIEAWTQNFVGKVFAADEEQVYALYTLSRFMYFGRRLVREMLRALYRDHFESPLRQRIRRNLGNTRDKARIDQLYLQELAATRFIGVGNPAESGAHLLYYFRQINHLPKSLFVDCAAAFNPAGPQNGVSVFLPHDTTVTRYVFFDDFVGSGNQASKYLGPYLDGIRAGGSTSELRFLALFATSNGLQRLNSRKMFDGNALCLFELDESFKAFSEASRYFANPPLWLDQARLLSLMKSYGTALNTRHPLGYENGQVLLGFSHNTPDNAPPVFWDEGRVMPWSPIFVRYDKNYGKIP